MFLILTPLSLVAESTIAFNWGYSQGIDQALKAARSDSTMTIQGYKIGPHFWKSLRDAQNDADHMAGDGLYYSTHPFDSSRFGPSLMIVEIEIDNLEDTNLIKSMSGEDAQIHPDKLPTIVRYRGSWHVIKSLPRDEKVKIWIREPTEKDVDFIFARNNLKNDLTSSLNLVTQISQRYGNRFRKFESAGAILKKQQSNKSTQKFITSLIEQLVENGLNTESVIFLNNEKKENLKSSLAHTLHILSQLTNEKNVFGQNMTKTIYKKLLSSSTPLPEDIINIFRNHNEDYFLKYNIQNTDSEAKSHSCQHLFL